VHCTKNLVQVRLSISKVKVTGDKKGLKCGILFGSRPVRCSGVICMMLSVPTFNNFHCIPRGIQGCLTRTRVFSLKMFYSLQQWVKFLLGIVLGSCTH